MVCTLLLSCVASAGMDDKVLRFSTPGIDRYADGSAVVDGECYALVWSPKGQTFAGFNADGTAIFRHRPRRSRGTACEGWQVP